MHKVAPLGQPCRVASAIHSRPLSPSSLTGGGRQSNSLATRLTRGDLVRMNLR